MAEIGDKSFTTDMIQLIKDAVKAELGTNAFVNRYLATVSAVDTATSDITVFLSGSTDAFSGFRARGLQLPAINDQVIACIDGQDRWIESVVRPATSTPYLQIASGSLVGAGAPTGAVLGYLWATPPSGWLLCNGATYNYDTYPALGALFGASAGGNFTLPDMRDRFMAGRSAAGTWTNTTGTLLSPNTAISAPAHTHNITHGHGDNFAVSAVSVSAHADHYHVANPGSATTGNQSVGAIDGTGFAYIASGATYRLHNHSFDAPADTTSAQQTSAGASLTLSHSVSGGAFSGAVTNLADPTASGAASATAIGTPKATLLNFIIKT